MQKSGGPDREQLIIERVRGLLGERLVRTDADSLQQYGRDWTRARDPDPLAIVLPETTAQVQAIVLLAKELSVALVPSGGRSGLSGGALAERRELVVSLERMNKVVEFNEIDQSLRCQAGVITAALQDYAAQQGCFYPVDFASAGSSQIGGNIATNAGGIKVLRYGMTRDQVIGLEVVTGNGDILELNRGLKKNNAGYDLQQLFIGSEGSLGIITEATLQLTGPPAATSVMVLACPGFEALMEVFRRARDELALTAFEFFSEAALQKVVANSQLQRPFSAASEYYALLEFETSGVDDAMSLFESALENAWAEDGVLSQSLEQAASLWRLREDISETISQWTPYKNDISARISRVPALLAEVEAIVDREYPDFEIIWFGHIGDGNVHLNILKPEDMPREEFLQRCAGVNELVCAAVQGLGGSISAEHGIGLLKKPYLGYTRSETEIALMRSIKAVFDPLGIMNPGKIIDP